MLHSSSVLSLSLPLFPFVFFIFCGTERVSTPRICPRDFIRSIQSRSVYISKYHSLWRLAQDTALWNSRTQNVDEARGASVQSRRAGGQKADNTTLIHFQTYQRNIESMNFLTHLIRLNGLSVLVLPFFRPSSVHFSFLRYSRSPNKRCKPASRKWFIPTHNMSKHKPHIVSIAYMVTTAWLRIAFYPANWWYRNFQ